MKLKELLEETRLKVKEAALDEFKAQEGEPTKVPQTLSPEQWAEIFWKAQAHKEQQQASKADLLNQFMDHLAAGTSPAKLNAMLEELGPDGFEVLQTLIGKAASGHGVKPSEEKGEVLSPAPKRRVLG